MIFVFIQINFPNGVILSLQYSLRVKVVKPRPLFFRRLRLFRRVVHVVDVFLLSPFLAVSALGQSGFVPLSAIDAVPLLGRDRWVAEWALFGVQLRVILVVAIFASYFKEVVNGLDDILLLLLHLLDGILSLLQHLLLGCLRKDVDELF